jgi:hypothetical protein
MTLNRICLIKNIQLLPHFHLEQTNVKDTFAYDRKLISTIPLGLANCLLLIQKALEHRFSKTGETYIPFVEKFLANLKSPLDTSNKLQNFDLE